MAEVCKRSFNIKRNWIPTASIAGRKPRAISRSLWRASVHWFLYVEGLLIVAQL